MQSFVFCIFQAIDQDPYFRLCRRVADDLTLGPRTRREGSLALPQDSSVSILIAIVIAFLYCYDYCDYCCSSPSDDCCSSCFVYCYIFIMAIISISIAPL